jgi:hypothetical protein
VQLAAFQRKVLEVEDGILRKDAGSVGAYNIVPLTQIVGEFQPWVRRMEWFLEVVELMMRRMGNGKVEERCTGAKVIDWLCEAMRTGYVDIEIVAGELTRVAEMAWVKCVAGWVLYGRLPSFGREDFFVQMADGDVQVCFLVRVDLDVKLMGKRSMRVRRSYFLLSLRHRPRLHCCLLGSR